MSQRNESPKASIWKSKNDKHAESVPVKGKRTTSSKKTTASSSKTQNRNKKDQRVQYQPKLMIDEDSESKNCLVKIGMRTSIRQVINFSLEKIRKDWTVTFNAFQQDLTKALQACEIIKTRVPFLYQENKLISWDVPSKEKDDVASEAEEDLKKESNKRIRTGLSITLSKVKFEITNVAGYQKPKPRQFLQPLPLKAKVFKKDDVEEVHKEEKSKKGQKNNGARSAQKSLKTPKVEENKENSMPKRKRGGKKKEAFVEERSNSHDRRRFSSQDEYYDRRSATRGYYHGYRDDSRKRLNKGPQHSKNFESDYEKPKAGGYSKLMHRPNHDRFFNDYHGPKTRGPIMRFSERMPEQIPFRDRQFKGGPPHQMRNFNYKGPGPVSRGPDFDKPDRPGYYAGSMRPFRMDKMRNEPLEREERGPPMNPKEHRDQRNRPTHLDRR